MAAMGLEALMAHLEKGQYIIVSLNASTISGDDDDRTKADHLVVVAAIVTDTDTVYLGDSGGPSTEGEQVSIETFEQALATSEHDMVVTDVA